MDDRKPATAASTDAWSPATLARAQWATRLAFLVSGFGLACWAPLVPFAKARLGIGDADLGLLLLCLGLGSVVAMQAAGALTARLGARPLVLAGGAGMALALPLLAIMPTAATTGAALLVFGGGLGAIDVAMNVHAVEVERHAGRPVMSGFHGLFSVGGFAGSSILTAFLAAGLPAAAGTAIAALLMLFALAVAAPRFVATPAVAKTPLIVVPHGIVLLLAALSAVTFLTEGAMLDWGALLLADMRLVGRAEGGIGYTAFSIAMTIGRLGGDRIVARLGDCRTMTAGGLLSVAGYGVLLGAPVTPVAIAGFLMIGLGASNAVPVLFRQAGAQDAMPVSLAIAAMTTIGYAGILAGPAAIGFVAHAAGLRVAFWMLAVLLCSVPLLAATVTARSPERR